MRYELLLSSRCDGKEGAKTDSQTRRAQASYGLALRQAIGAAQGEWILTLTQAWPLELAHIEELLAMATDADLVVGRQANARFTVSALIEAALARVLDIGADGLFSGYRLYRREMAQSIHTTARNEEILAEILVGAFADGWRVAEALIPSERDATSPAGRSWELGRRVSIRRLMNLWIFRNSIDSADYDARALDSHHPLQRYWQRKRLEIISSMLPSNGHVLDIGCGSSQIMGILRSGIGVDIRASKLRFSRRYGLPLVNADAFHLPFARGSFDCVLCSQMIEHVPRDDRVFQEMARVLRPGGRLIIGTPDYATMWPLIERLYKLAAPNAYADEHITRYTRETLGETVSRQGFRPVSHSYVCKSELIALYEYAEPQS